MTVAYNGAGFHGFARNEGVPTVAGVLQDALARVIGHRVVLACAGRTDRGVHALGQVVSFDADAKRVDTARLETAVNRMCGPGIAVSQAEVVGGDFDARFSCAGRVYRYQLLNAPVLDPLTAGVCLHVERSLNLRAMRTASDQLIGTHDFSSFCRRGSADQSLVRTVRRVAWHQQGDLIIFEIEGRSFCHQMVRSIVGLLVSVGSGRLAAAAVREVIAARDRNAAPSPAPPHGLILWRAIYS